MLCKLKIGLLILAFVLYGGIPIANAHPGDIDASGGHHCWTNCPLWGYAYGQYHFHEDRKILTPTKEECLSWLKDPDYSEKLIKKEIENLNRESKNPPPLPLESIANQPGFAGLSLSGAQRLQKIEEAGLKSLYDGLVGVSMQRQKKLEQLLVFSLEAFKEKTYYTAYCEPYYSIDSNGKMIAKTDVFEEFNQTLDPLQGADITKGKNQITVSWLKEHPQDLYQYFISSAFYESEDELIYASWKFTRNAKLKFKITSKNRGKMHYLYLRVVYPDSELSTIQRLGIQF